MSRSALVDKKAPVHRIRCGSIQALVWEKSTATGVTHEVTVGHVDSRGDHENPVFRQSDLMLLSKVLDDAHTWILRSAIPAGYDTTQWHS